MEKIKIFKKNHEWKELVYLWFSSFSKSPFVSLEICEKKVNKKKNSEEKKSVGKNMIWWGEKESRKKLNLCKKR